MYEVRDKIVSCSDFSRPHKLRTSGRTKHTGHRSHQLLAAPRAACPVDDHPIMSERLLPAARLLSQVMRDRCRFVAARIG